MAGWGTSNATPGWGGSTASVSIDPPRVSTWDTPVGAKPSSAGQDSSDWSQKAQEMVNSMGKDSQTHSNGSQSRGYQSNDTPPSRETSQQRDPHRSREFSRPRDDPPQDRRYSPPPPDDEPSVSVEEAWPGFVEADQSRDFDDVKPALARLCEAFKGKCWTDLEKKLRDEGCNTYLVATEDPVSFGYTLVNLKGEPNQKFRVIPSFIKPGTVKSGRMALGVASSYEENLTRLNDAGVVRASGIPRCHNCKQEGHITSTCPEEKREVERSKNFGKCYNCGAEDHRTRTCTEPRRSLSCRNCGKDGHMAKDCQAPPSCRRCGEEGHTSRDCTQRNDIECRRCKQTGHMARDCLEAPIDTCRRCGAEGHMVRDCPEPRTDMTCNSCGEVGHYARDCPTRTERSFQCHNCGESGHMSRECPTRTERTFNCHNCGESGHMARECTAPRTRTDFTCNNCGETGHMARECPSGRSCNRCGQPGHMQRDCSESLGEVVCRLCNQSGHIARDCSQRRESSMKCFQCGEVGHRANDCTNGGSGGYNGDRRRRPPRFGFENGF